MLGHTWHPHARAVRDVHGARVQIHRSESSPRCHLPGSTSGLKKRRKLQQQQKMSLNLKKKKKTQPRKRIEKWRVVRVRLFKKWSGGLTASAVNKKLAHVSSSSAVSEFRDSLLQNDARFLHAVVPRASRLTGFSPHPRRAGTSPRGGAQLSGSLAIPGSVSWNWVSSRAHRYVIPNAAFGGIGHVCIVTFDYSNIYAFLWCLYLKY